MSKLILALTLAAASGLAGWSQDLALRPGEKIDTIVVELGPDGFFPKQIVRQSRDRFHLLLRVTHGPGLTASRLESASGAVVKQTESARPVRRWSQIVDAAPGKYTVRAPGVTEHVLNITIP
jgi:hypothetical protein